MENANRTCNLILGVGDGKNEIFNSVRYSHSGKLSIFTRDIRVFMDRVSRVMAIFMKMCEN